jgi:hypothetical protein
MPAFAGMTNEKGYRIKFLDNPSRRMLQSSVDASSLYRLLEQRFDGEMPDYLRRAALAGGAGPLEIAAARAASRACDDLALTAQHQAALQRREAGLLLAWRAQGLVWRTRLQRR